jgi:hypothetical protein
MANENELTERQYRAMMATQGARLSPDQIAWLSPAGIAWLSPAGIAWLSPDQIARLSPDQIAWLSPDQIAWLSPAGIARLSPDQIAWLSPDQIARLSPAGIAWLSPDQIARLSPDQIARLSPDQIARLSPAGIEKHKALWDSVPLVDGLYSGILADIQAEKRTIKQSTFGPDTEPINICTTPMCIGGHTVNRAGHAGYALKNKYGWEQAAAMIHTKSRPGAPLPRYDSYPNEWALAYIEERAAEEVL